LRNVLSSTDYGVKSFTLTTVCLNSFASAKAFINCTLAYSSVCLRQNVIRYYFHNINRPPKHGRFYPGISLALTVVLGNSDEPTSNILQNRLFNCVELL
jgi:hypothetical protein